MIRCDIFIRIVIIGVVGFFYNIAVKSIELSVQNLKNSYNLNLLIIGLSNIWGYVTASSLFIYIVCIVRI